MSFFSQDDWTIIRMTLHCFQNYCFKHKYSELLQFPFMLLRSSRNCITHRLFFIPNHLHFNYCLQWLPYHLASSFPILHFQMAELAVDLVILARWPEEHTEVQNGSGNIIFSLQSSKLENSGDILKILIWLFLKN